MLKHLIKYTFSNIGTLLSVNKLFNEYKSLGYKLSKDTLYQYLSYLNDAFALFSMPIFRSSVREEQRHPRKIYAVDNGFKSLFTTSLSADLSKLYENLVYIQLRRNRREIYYLKQHQEVDFYSVNPTPLLINVSVDISSQHTLDREIKGLLEGLHYTGLDNALLLTKEREDSLEIKGKMIEIMPLWKWLLY